MADQIKSYIIPPLTVLSLKLIIFIHFHFFVLILESSQPLGAPGDPFSWISLILNVNYMPTNSLKGIFYTHI